MLWRDDDPDLHSLPFRFGTGTGACASGGRTRVSWGLLEGFENPAGEGDALARRDHEFYVLAVRALGGTSKYQVTAAHRDRRFDAESKSNERTILRPLA